jgi:hypothetical protein
MPPSDATENITSREQHTLRTELPEFELGAYRQKLNNWTDQFYYSSSWPAHRAATALLTDSVQTVVV